MIDVEKVIEGEFEPEDMVQALEASVLVERLQERVNKGKSNVFGYGLIRARVIYASLHDQAEGWNDPSVQWYEVAASAFKEEAERAIASGELHGYTKKEMSTFQNMVRTLFRAMSDNAPLLERDDVTGNFVLSGKTSIEQWNKQRQAEKEEAQRQASIAAAKAQGLELVPGVGSDHKAETGPEFADPDVQEAFDKYRQALHALLSHKDKAVNTKTGAMESATEKALRSLSSATKFVSILESDWEAMKKAANG